MLLPSFRIWETARSHRPWEVRKENELRPSELYEIVGEREDLEDWGKDAWEEFLHHWAEKVSCHGFHLRRRHKSDRHKDHDDCEKSAVWPAILIGAVILAIILISLCTVCWKRRQQRRIAQQENLQNQSIMYTKKSRLDVLVKNSDY